MERIPGHDVADPRSLRSLPGHDDELSIDEEVGSAAPLGEGRPPQERARVRFVTTAVAILGLACLALAYQASPWHHAAATLGEHPQRQGQKRTKMFRSLALNTNTEDLGTLCTTAIIRGDTNLPVQNTGIFHLGDRIVIADTFDGSSTREEAVVKSLSDGMITLQHPVTRSFPINSFVVRPAGARRADSEAKPAHAVYEPYESKRAQDIATKEYANVDFDCDVGYSNWAAGWSDQKKKYCCAHGAKGCEYDCEEGYANWIVGWSDAKKGFCCQTEGKGCKEDTPAAVDDKGPAFWAAVFGILFVIVACGIVCLAGLFRPELEDACIKCGTSFHAWRTRLPAGQSWWLFKPSDGKPIHLLSAPNTESEPTGEVMEPGEKFVVKSVVKSVHSKLEESDGGEGNCSFLDLADGRGWAIDREHGLELCYKLFEPVDEIWRYDGEKGRPMAIRDSAFIEAQRTREVLKSGEQFRVCEMQASEDTGDIIFLKLKDGRGWVFDQKSKYSRHTLCRRVLGEMWEVHSEN